MLDFLIVFIVATSPLWLAYLLGFLIDLAFDRTQ
jgi:hypothetical protein